MTIDFSHFLPLLSLIFRLRNKNSKNKFYFLFVFIVNDTVGVRQCFYQKFKNEKEFSADLLIFLLHDLFQLWFFNLKLLWPKIFPKIIFTCESLRLFFRYKFFFFLVQRAFLLEQSKSFLSLLSGRRKEREDKMIKKE